MGSKDHDEKSTQNEKSVSTSNLQLDPGLKDWCHYEIDWSSTPVADINIAAVKTGWTNATTGKTYNAGTEYWEVNTASLTLPNSLTISSTEHSWPDSPPAAPTSAQAFVSSTAATWQDVTTTTDLTTGQLYEYADKDYYVRFVISGSVPNALISKVRWYRKKTSTPTPSASFNPSGRYTAVLSLPSGNFSYADSK